MSWLNSVADENTISMPGIYDSASFADGDDLVWLHVCEALDLLGRRPLDLDCIYNFRFAQTKMQAQVSL